MNDDIDVLEAQLHAARRRLAHARRDVRRAGNRWRQLGEHLRAHPLLVAGAAAAAGFVLVGRRSRATGHALDRPASLPQRSLPARALGAGLRYGLEHLLPVLAAVAWERLSRAELKSAESLELQEFYSPRKPR